MDHVSREMKRANHVSREYPPAPPYKANADDQQILFAYRDWLQKSMKFPSTVLVLIDAQGASAASRGRVY